jgi:hypothetical protein
MRRIHRPEKPLAMAASPYAPLPPLEPYQRCHCDTCPECKSNARWDRVFAKFEAKEERQFRGFFRSPLSDL